MLDKEQKMADWNSSLVQDFVRAVVAAAGLETLAQQADETTTSRVAAEAINAAAKDPKFCDAWEDQEFRTAFWTALKSKSEAEILLYKMRRYLATIESRLPEGKTESELRAIGTECGLTDEDVENVLRQYEFKFNN
jgi:hypothetical protein